MHPDPADVTIVGITDRGVPCCWPASRAFATNTAPPVAGECWEMPATRRERAASDTTGNGAK